jgi:hypothetical protein
MSSSFFDETFVGVDVGDVFPVLSKRTVETVPLVTVAVDEKHHLPTLGALFAAFGDHQLPIVSLPATKSVRNPVSALDPGVDNPTLHPLPQKSLNRSLT